MGGDHKCPVCQATFTRPQHVARHMRSHTGDRPYKCQFCGDQFARSDLLSRHVNKCHANEKPPAGATTTRRKGSASASRASTSKQACDQCVQSSLPCDGANPCSKCIQRKCRCTFVKFHRQTAPIGPGHNPHPPANSTSSRLSSYGTADDFLLGPAPPSIAPIPGDPTTYNTSFTFPNLYTSTADSAPPSLAMPASGDYNKFRSQADYMRRMTLPQSSGPTLHNDPRNAGATSWLGWGSETTAQLAAGSRPVPATDHHPKSDHPSFTYPPVAADTYIPSYAVRRVPHDRHPSVEFSSDSSSHSVPSSASSSSVHLPLDDMASQQQQQHAYHVSLSDLDEHIKDILTAPSSESQADSIGIQDAQAQAHHNYLQYHQPHPAQQHQQGCNQGMHSGLPPHSNPNADSGQQEGGFSSAFGLMSLDDPSILAGLSNDGAPFFTNNGMDMYPGDPDATPMPPKSSTAASINNNNNNNNGKVTSHPIQPLSANSAHGSSASRDEELKVLKESWKQYLRTPLQGSTPNGLNFSFSNSGSGSGPSNPVSPGPPYRRARVSSLPSAQTPSTERSQSQLGYAYQPSGNGGGNDGGNGATSSIRTTLHGNPDDLRSYEAAILARRPPLNLNLNMDLAMKRSRGATASSGMSPVTLGNASSCSNPNPSANPQQMQPSQKRGYEYHPPGSSGGGSRPSSSSSLSLANAFGKSHSHPHTSANPAHHSHANVSANANAIFAYLANDHEQQHDGHGFSNMSPPSRGSTASLDESSNASEEGGDSGSMSRPSFKRSPSQTLAPMNAKRAMLNRRSGYGFGKEGGENGDGDDVAADEDYRRREIGYRCGQQQQQRDQQQQQQHLSPPQSHAMNVDRSGAPPPSSYGGMVAGRRRRMSAPDTSPTVGSFAAAGQL